MSAADILGWTATMLFTVCYIPQIIKTYKTKTVEGLSFRLLFISVIANIVALWYAILIKQPPLQIIEFYKSNRNYFIPKAAWKPGYKTAGASWIL